MAEEIVFSIMQQRVGDVEDVLLPLLKEFESETRIRVHLKTLTWSNGMDELLQNALHGEGPDVSEFGTTWVSSFVAMNTLHPFQPTDLRVIGTQNQFLPATWQSGVVEGGSQNWAIPWMVGMRVLFYRKDIFEKAGIDIQNAFQNHDTLYQTLEKLQENGIESPWAVPTVPTLNTLHYVANWLWSAGGKFISPDGQQVEFNSPESIIGLKKYFQLSRFLPQPSAELTVERVGDLFWKEGKVAAIIGGHWQLPAFEKISTPKVWKNLGIAPLPGIVFLGGSNLVIWEHVRNKMAAVRLVGFLTSDRVQKLYPPQVGLYPVRRETLTKAPFTEDPVYRELAARFETGRAYPSVSLWGVIERRLPRALADIWQAHLKNPDADLDDLLHKFLDPLAHRLAITLRR